MHFPEVGQSNGGTGGGKLFVKLDDGQSIQGVFQGDPRIFRQHWIKKKPFVCTGRETCQYCDAGDEAKFRFRINFLTQEDRVWIAKIFDGSYGTYLDLKALHDSGYDLENTLVRISRSGKEQQTRYSILPVPNNGKLKDSDFEKLKSIPLNELKGKDEASQGVTEFDQDVSGDVPF